MHRANYGESFLEHCSGILEPTIGHVHLSAETYSAEIKLTEVVNRTITPEWIDVFTRYMDDHPYVQRMLTNAPRHLETIQQEPTLKKFEKTALFNEFYTRVDGQNLLWMAAKNQGEILSIALLRKEKYSNNELSMASLIHPHLESAWKNWRRSQRLKTELDALKKTSFLSLEDEIKAAAIRHAIECLTPRQRNVVELVADGRDNQQIADQLKISILTVKKHLQSIFLAMDVQHRTALAAQWHQALSVPRHHNDS
ncbi:Transcriptional regulatory protein LiaR [Pontiella desulfatans]|uniref:Transcriptional regulatory protein LiaR n=1 Tax=Pontiella desulfatans TaxID=2750659 RepID=A0A6C2TZN8_PONDE|nr:Transcriptional regulatory protein LiaR [Pontiella desulfatans]